MLLSQTLHQNNGLKPHASSHNQALVPAPQRRWPAGAGKATFHDRTSVKDLNPAYKRSASPTPKRAVVRRGAAAAAESSSSSQLSDEQLHSLIRSLEGHEARCVGAVLAAVFGDCFGQAFESRSFGQVKELAPEGVRMFLDDGDPQLNRYSGDTAMTVALMRSLVKKRRCDAEAAAAAYGAAFDTKRMYRQFDRNVYQDLSDGEDYRETSGRYLLAARGIGGLVRMHPLGLAHRNADPACLAAAVNAALLSTHNYPDGLDAARVQAAAAAWLAGRQLGEPGCTPSKFLDHLIPLAQGDRLRKSLKLMRLWVAKVNSKHGAAEIEEYDADAEATASAAAAAAAFADDWFGDSDSSSDGGKAQDSSSSTSSGTSSSSSGGDAGGDATASVSGRVDSWQEYLSSERFTATVKVHRMVGEDVAQTVLGPVLTSLWACCCCFDAPEDAVYLAIHLGGYCRTTAAMTGGLAGALHGSSWIPDTWWLMMENGPGGRDELVALARQLAELDVRE